MLVKTYASAVMGISAEVVTIEVDITIGIRFFLVGLPDSAVKESQQRIETALRAIGYHWPGKQITINMAPADLRKEGSAYDLPLAIGILAANEKISVVGLDSYLIMGELSLDASIKPIRGALSMAICAKEAGFKGIILPSENAAEAAVVQGIDVYGMKNLAEVIDFLSNPSQYQPITVDIDSLFGEAAVEYGIDFADVKGQESVKRALEVAVAGHHNAIMIGPPGSGKTMLAKRLPTIMPPLTLEEALETTKIHSVAGKKEVSSGLMVKRPFRNPHNSISSIALVGGGSYPQPGEISLAHNGILFLDELPEFTRQVLEVMRQPLEDRIITVSRAKMSVNYPASFMMVAGMNPCPCGYYNHPTKECTCTPGMIQKYMAKISGPLLDRIDIQIEVFSVEYANLSYKGAIESSAEIRKRVVAARAIQQERFKEYQGVYSNAQMNAQMQKRFCALDTESEKLLKMAMEFKGLSARAYDRILKVSRTIADLAGTEHIAAEHIAEAINYRNLDREG